MRLINNKIIIPIIATTYLLLAYLFQIVLIFVHIFYIPLIVTVPIPDKCTNLLYWLVMSNIIDSFTFVLVLSITTLVINISNQQLYFEPICKPYLNMCEKYDPQYTNVWIFSLGSFILTFIVFHTFSSNKCYQQCDTSLIFLVLFRVGFIFALIAYIMLSALKKLCCIIVNCVDNADDADNVDIVDNACYERLENNA